MHISSSAYYFGMSCNPARRYGMFKNPEAKRRGNPRYHLASRKVAILLHKRSLGLSLAVSSRIAGWKSTNPARDLFRKLRLPIDTPRHNSEVKISVVAEYKRNVSITEISKRYSIPTTSIYRWVCESGELGNFGDRKAIFCSQKPAGRESIAKKNVFHTKKGGEWIPTDSSYELARLHQLEANDLVAHIGRCTDRIRYALNGKVRSYIPDFFVIYSDGSMVVEEVKPLARMADESVLAKKSAAIEFYKDKNISYIFVTEKDIGHFLKEVSDVENQKLDPAYLLARAEKRRAQKMINQRNYTRRKRERQI